MQQSFPFYQEITTNADDNTDSDDERQFAQWLEYHRFKYKLHPVFEGKVWDFWIPGFYSLVEVKPFAFWAEIDPLRRSVLKQIQEGRRTRALFVEMGRNRPFFHELITPQSVKAIGL